jgi:hypothetical protein
MSRPDAPAAPPPKERANAEAPLQPEEHDRLVRVLARWLVEQRREDRALARLRSFR